MKRRLITLFVALAMLLGLLSGCGNSDTTETPEPTSDAGVSTVPSESTAEVTTNPEPSQESEETLDPAIADTSEPEPTESIDGEITFATADGNPMDAPEYPVSLPVTDSTESVSLYMIFSPAVIGMVGQLADENIAWSTFTQQTGLNLDIHLVHPGSKATEVSLMLASQSYLDIMQDVVTDYIGGGDQAIEDEVLYDITDMVYEYAPNFWSKITWSEEVYEKVATESGRLVGFSRISSDLLGSDKGVVIRQDWLDGVGMDKPVTVDDWHRVLSAFGSEYDSGGMWISGTTAYMGMDILSAYGGSSEMFVKDGQVRFGPIEDSYKQYLELLSGWYTEGLIYTDFYTNTEDMLVEDIPLMATKKLGIGATEVMKISAFDSVIEGSEWVALASPVLNSGDVLHTGGTKDYYAEMADLSITTACKNPEIVCAAFDYLYTKEGSILANYGVEGVTFEYDENNEPKFGELITNNPDYDLKTAIMMNCMDIGPYVRDVYRTMFTYTDNQIEAYGIWYNDVEHDFKWVLPDGVTLTPEESEEFSALQSEYDTYFQEHSAKFIIGDSSLEEFDEYAGMMRGLGVDRAIEIYQAAYERYLAK